MSRTKRSIAVLKHNWHYKCNSWQDFRASSITDYDGDMCGYKIKARHKESHLLSAYEDEHPSAIYEVKHPSQVK